ncbi:MAG: PAC2 family protein [Gaiellaceae bacterium]|jgi:proteasome assembly chaperone (PAC2) family protein
MSALRFLTKPRLRRPVLIIAFQGWNDGGQGATLAAGYLARSWNAARFAEIDPEEFFDFQATRPQVSLVEGETRELSWPENAFFHARVAGINRDVVLLIGVEPNLRWRAFSELVSGFTHELGVETVITLGSLLADVPHTRPSPVTAGGNDLELLERLDCGISSYEGPTGIVGVLQDAFQKAGTETISFWAAVPHYVSLTPSPRAALALCQRTLGVLGTELDMSELEQAVDNYTEHVSEAVAGDEETASYVEALERQSDADEPFEAFEPDIPSGELLAAELAKFLREREADSDDSGSAAGQ